MSNAWYVQCKPFDENDRNKPDVVKNFHQKCYEKRLFGMGWNLSEMQKNHKGETINEDLMNEYREKRKEDDKNHKGKFSGSFTAAQNCYGEMQEGDVVLTRFEDEYYLGIVKYKPQISEEDRFSWSSEVDVWRSLKSRKDLPHHISGLLASRSMTGTIARIKGLSKYTLFTLAGKEGVEREKVTKDNFATALGDADLEDVVAEYMAKQNPKFIFLPSSCKQGTPEIEFIMYNPENGHQLCCQTKVNAEIDVKTYADERYKKYEGIYLFSGKKCINEKYKKDNVHIIDNAVLFDSLKKNAYFRNEIEKYFEFD